MLQQPRPPGSLRRGGFAGMLPIPDFELLAPLDRGDIDRLGIMRNALNERHDSTPCYTRRHNADVPFLFLRTRKARGEACGSSKTVAKAMPPHRLMVMGDGRRALCGERRHRWQAFASSVSAMPCTVPCTVSPTWQLRRDASTDFEPIAPSWLRAVTTSSSGLHLGFGCGPISTITASTARFGCSEQAATRQNKKAIRPILTRQGSHRPSTSATGRTQSPFGSRCLRACRDGLSRTHPFNHPFSSAAGPHSRACPAARPARARYRRRSPRENGSSAARRRGSVSRP